MANTSYFDSVSTNLKTSVGAVGKYKDGSGLTDSLSGVGDVFSVLSVMGISCPSPSSLTRLLISTS